MSRETLLDEAIAKAKEAEDWQLVEWLRMARGGESAARWYTVKHNEARLDISKLMTENAKLRELVRELLHHIEHPPCEGCMAEMSCLGDVSQCDEYVGWLKPRARELGIEVDG